MSSIAVAPYLYLVRAHTTGGAVTENRITSFSPVKIPMEQAKYITPSTSSRRAA